MDEEGNFLGHSEELLHLGRGLEQVRYKDTMRLY